MKKIVFYLMTVGMKMRTDYRDELLICQKIPAEYEAMA